MFQLFSDDLKMMCYNELIRFRKNQTINENSGPESFNLKKVAKSFKSPYELAYCMACDYLLQNEDSPDFYS